MLPLRIIDINFNLIDEITKYASLQLTRKHHEIGEIEIKINRYSKGANELTKDRITFPLNQQHKVYQIKHREIELDENGKETENWFIKALPLKSWLTQRLILPPDGKSNYVINDNAETVMKHYIVEKKKVVSKAFVEMQEEIDRLNNKIVELEKQLAER